MIAEPKYENLSEERLHRDAIQRLAKDLNRETEEVGTIYEQFLSGVRHQAKIKDYLVILVSRQVKDVLRRKKPTTAGHR